LFNIFLYVDVISLTSNSVRLFNYVVKLWSLTQHTVVTKIILPPYMKSLHVSTVKYCVWLTLMVIIYSYCKYTILSIMYVYWIRHKVPYFPIDNAGVIYTKTFSKRKKTTVRIMQWMRVMLLKSKKFQIIYIPLYTII
jgi:hypothetical protein